MRSSGSIDSISLFRAAPEAVPFFFLSKRKTMKQCLTVFPSEIS